MEHPFMSPLFPSRTVLAIAAALLLAAPLTAPAQSAGAASGRVSAPLTAEATTVKKLLEERFPGAQVKHIAKTNILGGLYEAMFDDQLVYTDAKVTYLVVGAIYDIKSKVNLTEQQARKLNRVAWNELPLNLAIKKVKGDGSRRLAVFSDADCPFCARLEENLKKIDNVTVYTFLYPIDQLHPDAARKSRLIWCAPDRVKAWDDFFAKGSLPDNAGDCENPVAATQALGSKFRVSATPTLIFADGTVVPGAIPVENMEAELTRAEAEAKKLAATK
jgi:thiol:disulfide interchange protein DsbC